MNSAASTKEKYLQVCRVKETHADWSNQRIADYLGLHKSSVQRALARHKAEALGDVEATLARTGAAYQVNETAQIHGQLIHNTLLSGEMGTWKKFGLVADTHLCCKEERLAELHATYDLFQEEGITDVFHAGNLVEGFIQRINGSSVLSCTIDGQTEYAAKNYPARDGIKTYFITGDDHEGWWIKTGFNWGRYMEDWAIREGREDLVYMGHVEADVTLQAEDATAIMKIQHPGGGSSYARSYTGQKQVEAFEGGEKPQILVQGHYHVYNHMRDRNVHVIGLPGFQDQTVFARKKRLRMEVGAAIAWVMQSPDGAIQRFCLEHIAFFTRGYYKPYLLSDDTPRARTLPTI